MTIDPNELADRWRSLAGTRGDMGSGARRTCADELNAALTWYPMTDEPKGTQGALVGLDIHNDADFRLLEWLGHGWGNLAWKYWSHQYPNATWCYLPRRKNDAPH